MEQAFYLIHSLPFISEERQMVCADGVSVEVLGWVLHSEYPAGHDLL